MLTQQDLLQRNYKLQYEVEILEEQVSEFLAFLEKIKPLSTTKKVAQGLFYKVLDIAKLAASNPLTTAASSVALNTAYNAFYNPMALVWSGLYGSAAYATIETADRFLPDNKPVKIASRAISVVLGSYAFGSWAASAVAVGAYSYVKKQVTKASTEKNPAVQAVEVAVDEAYKLANGAVQAVSNLKNGHDTNEEKVETASALAKIGALVLGGLTPATTLSLAAINTLRSLALKLLKDNETSNTCKLNPEKINIDKTLLKDISLVLTKIEKNLIAKRDELASKNLNDAVNKKAHDKACEMVTEVQKVAKSCNKSANFKPLFEFFSKLLINEGLNEEDRNLMANHLDVLTEMKNALSKKDNLHEKLLESFKERLEQVRKDFSSIIDTTLENSKDLQNLSIVLNAITEYHENLGFIVDDTEFKKAEDADKKNTDELATQYTLVPKVDIDEQLEVKMNDEQALIQASKEALEQALNARLSSNNDCDSETKSTEEPSVMIFCSDAFKQLYTFDSKGSYQKHDTKLADEEQNVRQRLNPKNK